MIDWDRVENLRREIGNDDFADVVALFLEETDEVIARLPAQSGADLRADLHFLKGSALNLGFRALALHCGQGEAALQDATGLVDPAPIVALYHATRSSFIATLPGDQIRNSANTSSLVMSR